MVVLVAGGFLFWKNRRDRESLGLGWAASALVLFFLVLPHANPYYLIFAFPLWLLTALVGFTYTKRWAWLPACLTLMWLVEYGYRYKTNVHAGYQPPEITRVGDAIKQVEKTYHLDDRQWTIVGEPSLWYAHPSRYRSASAPDLQHADIYLCYQRLLPRHDPSDTTTCDVLLSHVPQLVPVTQVDVKGTPLVLYRPRK